jgi:aldehyde:ferredoxin oxidoreductase
MNKKVNSFADRVGLMASSAEYLRNIAKIVEAEAKAMAEAQQRFAAKKPTQKRPANSAE